MIDGQRWRRLAPAALLLATIMVLIVWQWRVGAIFFNDMGRDFLLAKDLFYHHKLTLYGGRTSLEGVYHGPGWIYFLALLLPLVQGSPLWLSELWVVLGGVLAWLTGRLVWQQTKSRWSSWLAAGLMLWQIPSYCRGVTNPYGVIWMVPLAMWSWWQWQQTKRWGWGALAFLAVAAAIQFELAIGIPLLLLMLMAAVGLVARSRRWVEGLVVVGAVPPLLTYLAFELKNHFLQTHAVLTALASGHVTTATSTGVLLQMLIRISESWWHQALWPTGNTAFMSLAGLIFVWSLFLLWRRGPRRQHFLAIWVTYFFFGSWLLGLIFPGPIQYYYFWGWSAVSVAIVGMAWPLWPRRWWRWLMSMVLLVVPTWLWLPTIVSGLVGPLPSPRLGEWRFYQQVTANIYAQAKEPASYYAYSADQFAYTWKYAMWWQDQRQTIKIAPYQKSTHTFLIMEPSDNPYTNPTAWKTNQVRLSLPPVQHWISPDGVVVEQYQLNPTEQQLADDPNLLRGTEMH